MSDLQHIREALQAGSLWQPTAPAATFHYAMLDGLPAPARRYFQHAIEAGVPLARSALVQMSGEMRLQPDGAWWSVQAEQVLAPPRGFTWQGRLRRGLVRVTGADYYSAGQGRRNFRLWGVFPIMRRQEDGLARSARGKLALESIWNPAALLPRQGVLWKPLDEDSAQAMMLIDGDLLALTFTVAPDGQLRSVSLLRWSEWTDDGHYTLIPYGADVVEERQVGGYTIPSRLEAGWWYGAPQYFSFFRPVVEHVEYRT